MSQRRVSGRSEAGMTLAEVLVAITILGIAVASIASAIASVSTSSDRHRKEVNADAAVRSYAEYIKQTVDSGNYVAAPTTASYPYTAPTGYTADITAVSCLYQATPTVFSACTSTPSDYAQQLKLRVYSNDGRDQETLDIVVRKP